MEIGSNGDVQLGNSSPDLQQTGQSDNSLWWAILLWPTTGAASIVLVQGTNFALERLGYGPNRLGPDEVRELGAVAIVLATMLTYRIRHRVNG